MESKYFAAVFIILLSATQGTAQRIKRKGVTPVDVTKKTNTPGKEGGNAFRLEQFTGKWQETSRVDRNKNLAIIADTILLNFPTPGKAITREGNHSNIIGAAEIDAPGNDLCCTDD